MNMFDERFPVKFGEKDGFDIPVDLGEVQIIYSGNAEHYDGEYIITPKANKEQTMETLGKIMDNNVTIKAIPRYDVSNQSGGDTVFIAKEI